MNKKSLTASEDFIILFLKGRDWTSPTKIGESWGVGYHSAWASPKCKKLVKIGLLKRNKKGWYKLTH